MSQVPEGRPVSGAADPGGSHADPDAGRMAGQDAPAAPNQQKTEPIPPSSADGSGTATTTGPREGWATAPPSSAPSGDAQGVPVPSETPAEGTSEGVAPVEGIAFPAIAPEGLADGEPDVAMPSTTSF